jgi:hypothetical protein
VGTSRLGFRIWLMVLQENFRGTIATLCFLVLSIFLLLAMVATTSSVVKTDQIVGTIESAVDSTIDMASVFTTADCWFWSGAASTGPFASATLS